MKLNPVIQASEILSANLFNRIPAFKYMCIHSLQLFAYTQNAICCNYSEKKDLAIDQLIVLVFWFQYCLGITNADFVFCLWFTLIRAELGKSHFAI